MTKTISGRVVSDKMKQTAVVEIVRLTAHPLYMKRMRHTNKMHAHNEVGAKLGDMVEIQACKPISKTKNWIVTKIIK